MATRFMSVGKVKPFVDRTGAESSAHQFVREAYKNAEEAGATKVHIGFELGATRLGIYRFIIADDGRSMSRHELPSFINKYGGGGKPIGGHHENFGVGLKSSTLPWNHHGVLVVARHEGETNLIQLHLDGEANEYGLREWNTEDEQGNAELVDVLTIGVRRDDRWEAVVDQDWEPVKGTRIRDLMDAFIHDEHGTLVILCGNTGTENTYLATGAGGEMGQGGHTGIATYLSRRFLQVTLAVTVAETRTGDVADWPTSPDDFKSTILSASTKHWKTKTRNPIGLGEFLERGGERGAKRPEASGVVQLSDGTKARWYLLPKDDEYDSKGAGGVYWSPSIAVSYDGEVYLWGGSQPERFRQFGITRKSVHGRCTIILEPPRNNGGPGVYPDSSRSRLLWTGGKDLPWSQWAREFSGAMPPEIEQALQDATAELARLDVAQELSDAQRKRLNAVTTRIRSAWRRLWRRKDDPTKAQIVRVRSLGNVGGRGSGGGGGHGRGGGGQSAMPGAAERFVEDPVGEERVTVSTPRPDALPAVEWLPALDFDTPQFIARWNESGFKIEANYECPIIRDSIDYWTSENPGLDQQDVMAAVTKLYGLKLRTAAAHMMTAHRRGQITSDELQQALNPLSLTLAASGFLVEDTALAGDIGALEGRRRKALKDGAA
jgi:hypothetical protein